MKTKILHIILIIIFSVAVSNLLYSQSEKKETPASEQDKTPVVNDGKPMPENKSEDDFKPFVDKDGDGINDADKDNNENKKDGKSNRGKHRRERNKDKFIDTDGDGINDNRCKGMGLGNCRRGGARGGRK